MGHWRQLSSPGRGLEQRFFVGLPEVTKYSMRLLVWLILRSSAVWPARPWRNSSAVGPSAAQLALFPSSCDRPAVANGQLVGALFWLSCTSKVRSIAPMLPFLGAACEPSAEGRPILSAGVGRARMPGGPPAGAWACIADALEAQPHMARSKNRSFGNECAASHGDPLSQERWL